MKYIKFSFYYISAYLGLAGVAFLFFPTQFQKLLLADKIYDPVPMHIAGMFAMLLSIVIFQVARKQLFQMYPTTLFARTIALVIIFTLYFQTRNPQFLTISVIVIVGVVLTLIGHFKKSS